MSNGITRLWELGQSPWYDNLTREHARGGLTDLMARAGIRGVTSNPTIFERAMAAGELYDRQIADLAASGSNTKEIYWALVSDDIAGAVAQLAELHTSSGGLDGYVSVEVDPDLANDTAQTVAQAKSLFSRLDLPNVMIKIPATVAGLPAVTECIAAGLNVNVTLIFSLERYETVIDVYLAGLEQRLEAGHPVDGIASVASFFVSRVDTETDRRLPEGHTLRGRSAVANARLAYRRFEERFSGSRWEALAANGANVQRPLWASTSTKNPDYSPTLYVDTLIGAQTVNTLAQGSIDALSAVDPAGMRPDTVREGIDEAQSTLDGLASAGVDFSDVTAQLWRPRVSPPSPASFHDALSTLAKKAEQLSG